MILMVAELLTPAYLQLSGNGEPNRMFVQVVYYN
jgi:hypothetical protein